MSLLFVVTVGLNGTQHILSHGGCVLKGEPAHQKMKIKQFSTHPTCRTATHRALNVFTQARTHSCTCSRQETHTNTESTTQLDFVTHNTLQPSLTVRQNERPT